MVTAMAEYINREAAMTVPVLPKEYRTYRTANLDDAYEAGWNDALENLRNIPAAENLLPVVRCQDCINAVPLDCNCELNEIAYLHCNLWRGEETKNVWHKYKKYYKDYSLVDRDGFCSSGERRDNETD